jgi:5-methylcytosine-specific restriction endonuclease McrA
VELGAVRERDLWHCVRCGRADWLHVHHRRMRSQGGKDTFSNLVTLCVRCHEWVHHHPALAAQGGLLLRAGSDSTTTALHHWSWSQHVLLCDDGTISFV